MYLKMMEISAVCGLGKEQLFVAALAYLLDLSAFLICPLLHSLFLLSLPQNKWGMTEQQSDQAHWILQIYRYHLLKPWSKTSKIIIEQWI